MGALLLLLLPLGTHIGCILSNLGYWPYFCLRRANERNGLQTEWLRSPLKRMKKVNKNGLSGYASNPLFTFSVTTKKSEQDIDFLSSIFLNFLLRDFFLSRRF